VLVILVVGGGYCVWIFLDVSVQITCKPNHALQFSQYYHINKYFQSLFFMYLSLYIF